MTFLNYSQVNELAEELSQYTGEPVPQTIVNALRERLEREKKKRRQFNSLREEILRIGQECAALPQLDTRSTDEILGYDERGVPV